MVVPGTAHTDKNHAKISREYFAMKRWLRGLFSHFAHARHLMHPKISREYVAIKLWLSFPLSHFEQSRHLT